MKACETGKERRSITLRKQWDRFQPWQAILQRARDARQIPSRLRRGCPILIPHPWTSASRLGALDSTPWASRPRDPIAPNPGDATGSGHPSQHALHLDAFDVSSHPSNDTLAYVPEDDIPMKLSKHRHLSAWTVSHAVSVQLAVYDYVT